ncbi:Rossmann-like and DUF2520 domain-containing protein [Croceimicrobium hydrocarbonivorans]|uniref:DUF2520 domain-containing protein n=1 Tax=Croceimicrobium hydrocarbonivorans TaxID=2761580 RepID=A0A7H0VDM2_9FLAO|nr:DUF2520 domain-containing protein [Croceimicrobium hydrocarbonivorans]QNR23820.1 DUF2520 domain-containing protein [Croceimicrobium hydrocarbonivorans]
MIHKIAIIGNGKVGTFLSKAFADMGLDVSVYARNPKSASQKKLSELGDDSDLCLICIADRNIAELTKCIPAQKGILAHSSGTVPLEDLDIRHPNRGIFYPLMSLQAESEVDIQSIPFCLEASSESILNQLKSWAQSLDLSYYEIDSKKRKQLHLAAVISHNFSNYLYHWAWQVLQKADIDFEILKPLLSQQVKGLSAADPILNQTGPAVRGDLNTIKAHQELLENPELADLYQKLSTLIQQSNEKEL